MTLQRLLIVGGLALATPAVSLVVAQDTEVSVEGSWTGRTSQGRTIAFRIESAGMTMLDLDWTLQLDRVCPDRTGQSARSNRIQEASITYFDPSVKGYEPPRIRYPSFEISREVGTSGPAVTVVLAGSFGSDSTVSGDLTLTAKGCQGQEIVSWNAGRRPVRVASSH